VASVCYGYGTLQLPRVCPALLLSHSLLQPGDMREAGVARRR